jgi:hypothetical protein
MKNYQEGRGRVFPLPPFLKKKFLEKIQDIEKQKSQSIGIFAFHIPSP